MANKRQITITTPLAGKLELVSMHGEEELGRLFCYEVSLLSNDENINPENILGHPVTINVELDDGSYRYFNGIVSRFSQQGITKRNEARYSAIVHPWLWLLTRSSNCRMFQDMTVPAILEEIFNDNGFSDFENHLNGDYQALEYCAQYRETDFNFVSRLMEQEGIYYFFKHEDGKHNLILADAYNSHQLITGESTIAYHGAGLGLRKDEYTVSNLISSNELQSGNYSLSDYDFKKPKSNLLVNRSILNAHPQADRELFDYPGGYTTSAEGEEYALKRIEEKQSKFRQISADTDARTITVGGLFALSEHPRDDINIEFLISRCKYELNASGFVETSDEPFQCQFSAIDANTSFRTPRTTAKPYVHGPQPAVVAVDTTDEYGRVKVRFYWDREEQDSCWVRVSQNSAGSGWGSMYVPHVGHEVIVSFYEGDPDRPVITGKVYNADNMPPDLWEGGTSNIVFTDPVGNKINFNGGDSSNPVIHITQPSGNEIKIENTVGIEIRDKFKNQIVMDEKGCEILDQFDNKVAMTENGISQTTPWHTEQWTKATSDITVLGFAHSFFGGLKVSETVGLQNDIFIGGKATESLARTYDIFYGYKYSRTYGKTFTVNKAKEIKQIEDREIDAEKKIQHKAPILRYIAGESSIIISDPDEKIELKSGSSKLEIKKDKELFVTAKTKVNLSGPDQVSVSAKKGSVDIKAGSKGLNLKSKGAVKLDGTKINIG